MSERREGRVQRGTAETAIRGRLGLDGDEGSSIETGLGFLDHMLASLAFHAGFDLELVVERGDLEVDDHHTVEDCAIVLAETLRLALGDRSGIERFGEATVPLDEALVRVVLDISGRPLGLVDLGFRRERIGTVATENLSHFFESLARSGGLTLHVDRLRGENDHHVAEAAFKALGRALRMAVARRGNAVPSLKGVLG